MKKNHRNILYYSGGFAALVAVLLPSVSHAMVFKDVVNFILINIIERTIVPFLISLSVLAFLWGVLQYIRKEYVDSFIPLSERDPTVRCHGYHYQSVPLDSCR